LATTAFPFILLSNLNRDSVKEAFGLVDASLDPPSVLPFAPSGLHVVRGVTRRPIGSWRDREEGSRGSLKEGD
jgi:hypothetical protein